MFSRAIWIPVLACALGCGRAPVPDAPPIPAPPPPQVTGALAVDGLSAQVTIVRDRSGIPHITASAQDDLFFAQGFVQAQDRLFQMDLWRRSVQGRLAEVLGSNFIERDAMTRRVQYRGSLDAEWTRYAPDARAIATAFTRGINAWIDLTRDRLPEEFALAGWAPERWSPDDLLNRTEAFMASAGAEDELFAARLAGIESVDKAASLLAPGPPAPSTRSTGVELGAINHMVAEMLHRVGTPPFFLGLMSPVPGVRGPDDRPRTPAPILLASRVRGLSFALGPARSATGRPLLAASWVDDLEQPATRYLVHLQGPGWNVLGATAPWRPGVAIGHNERIAWAFVPTPLDTQDVVVERLNPQNPHQVAVRGGWRDMTVVTERVFVKGRAEPYDAEALYTSHGVVMAVDRERQLAYTVRWSGTDPGGAPELAQLALGRAGSWTEFRTALVRWKMPAATFVYADVDGHVATQVAGAVPDRPAGQGGLPSPGWTGDGEWRARLSLDRLPRTLDPLDAMAVAAPTRLADTRVRERHAGQRTTLDAARATQRDVVSLTAAHLIPLLTAIRSADASVEAGRQRLIRWDRIVSATASEPLLYTLWEQRLRRGLAGLRVPPSLVEEFMARADVVLVPAMTAPSAVWFDGDLTRARDALLLDALAAALDDERRVTAGDTTATWGRLQAVTFRHPLAITDRARRRYEVGPLAVPGSADTLFSVAHLSDTHAMAPVMELVFDVGDWDGARGIVAPGQSAAPDSPHAADLAALWREAKDVALPFSPGAVAAAAADTLVLNPR